jgi:hypothetical protein
MILWHYIADSFEYIKISSYLFKIGLNYIYKPMVMYSAIFL